MAYFLPSFHVIPPITSPHQADNKPDYSVNASHSVQFYRAARKYLPFLEPEDLTPDQAGVRPKLQKPGDPVRDFLIRDEKEKGYPGFVNLIGIESPGLTACLSIADYVSRLIHAD